ncbi:hypothetical protein [Streptomyces sp. NBC_00555]|uniref:hypothetical protein n=1 Tax=Streptomyces sp. NBC_00555 TaxID=2903662 RepID=UPI00225BB796|nr:hypothetical protein [Streptomyces sp. NBC_00555]
MDAARVKESPGGTSDVSGAQRGGRTRGLGRGGVVHRRTGLGAGVVALLDQIIALALVVVVDGGFTP